MGVLEAALAVIGVLALVGIIAVVVWPEHPEPEPVAEVDLAAPYREGLHAAIRMQGVAQDLEQQLYVEAMRLSVEAESADASEGPERP
jgi:hypothetical protein